MLLLQEIASLELDYILRIVHNRLTQILQLYFNSKCLGFGQLLITLVTVNRLIRKEKGLRFFNLNIN